MVALSLCMGTFCACTAPAGATPAANTPYAAVGDASGYLSRLNSERAAHGLPSLIMRADLTQVAVSWSEHMAATGVLQHNPQLATAVTNWRAVGENVGDGPSIQDLDAAFMASPKHRDNILDPTYDDVGIGTVTRDGMIWITVDFRDVDRPEPTTRAAPQHRTVVVRATAWTNSMLWIGASGSRVRVVQRRLHVTDDGIFGPVTRRAVESFQQHNRLVIDGVVGPQTWAALSRHRTTKHRSAVRRCSGLSMSCAG
jgi:peptidoglycan hydrolase-like protein with peptidoglycan-binding domain